MHHIGLTVCARWDGGERGGMSGYRRVSM